MGQPTGVETPRQLKLALSRNVNRTVDKPDKLDKNTTDYKADEMTLRNIALHINGKTKIMPGFAATTERIS